MRLEVVTIVLDGLPWLAAIYTELCRTQVAWHWHIVEGACSNAHCSRWMQNQPPRLSKDGTTSFLDAIAHDPRVSVYRKKSWDGKLEMVNEPLPHIKTDCVLLQVDSDELWSADQLQRITYLFDDDPELMNARFHCRYFVGPGLICTDEGRDSEWLRAWRFKPGMRWVSHEPPNLAGNTGKSMHRKETKELGLVFDHYSWCLPKQVEQKQALYGPKYKDAVKGWERLQKQKEFPVRLRDFFPWCEPHVMVERL